MTKFDLIPDSSIEALADRFELGQKNYGEEAWNAHDNEKKLEDENWIKERIRHGYSHLGHYLSVLRGYDNIGHYIEDDGDDDGAAIMWLGCMLHEAWIRRRTKNEQTRNSIEKP